ncbi:DNA/RNA non-specific endonuclease [Lysinibacillus sp. NPDC056232]|uniref:DNA/RNA non-specific endonuclease n=1 Tax=Lysinibacillus sp. NPDC056232 TaxID=3345756 RepID=UPI0035D8C1F1
MKGFFKAVGNFLGSIPVVRTVIKIGKNAVKGIKKLGRELGKYIKRFAKKLGKIYTKARKKARRLKRWLIRRGKRIYKVGTLWLKNTIQKGARWVQRTSKQVYQKANQIYNKAVSVVKTAAKEVAKTYTAIEKGKFDATVDIVKDIYGEVKKFVAHPIGYLNDSIAGTVEGAYNLVFHPVQTVTGIKDSVKDSFKKDVINGDAYSRSYWGTKTVLNIAKEFAGRKGTGLLDNIPNSTNRIITNSTRPNLSKDPKKPEETNGSKKVEVPYGEHITKDGNKKVLQPNVKYKTEEGYSYETNEFGHINSVEADLQLGKGKRNQYAQSNAGGTDRIRGKYPERDDGGHLIGSQFKGPGGIDNLVPMNSQINEAGGVWHQMEQEWASALEKGETVNVKIKPQYTGDSARPDSFIVDYSIDGGRTQKVTIQNQIGG